MHQIVKKLWGEEKIIANNYSGLIEGYGYCLKEILVEPNGNACSIHYHAFKTETFYVTKGILMLELYIGIGTKKVITDPTIYARGLMRHGLFRMASGDSMTIYPGEPHRFWAEADTGFAVFMEGSTPDNPNDSYRIVPSGPKPKWAEDEVSVISDE